MKGRKTTKSTVVEQQRWNSAVNTERERVGGSCPPSPFNVYSPFSSLLLDNSKFSGFSPFHLWFILPVWFWFCAVLALEDLCPLQSPTFTSLLFASQDTLGPSDDRKDCYYCRETFLQCAGGLPEFLNESKWFCLK